LEVGGGGEGGGVFAFEFGFFAGFAEEGGFGEDLMEGWGVVGGDGGGGSGDEGVGDSLVLLEAGLRGFFGSALGGEGGGGGGEFGGVGFREGLDFGGFFTEKVVSPVAEGGGVLGDAEGLEEGF